MTEFAMTINGAPADSPTTFDVVNPATEEVYGHAPECAPEQLDAAVEAAELAYRTWRQDEAVRVVAMNAAANALKQHANEIAVVLTAEQGKPLKESVAEVLGSAAWISYYANLEVSREVIQDDKHARVEVVRRPLGVVAAITPWNFPLLLAAWKIGPALRAGNTMVLKPSPFTPLSSLKVGEVLRDVLPQGVFNVVSGAGSLGAQLSGHPAVRKVSLTGSIDTGKRVASAAAGDLKRLTLELGGNDPAIVLDDADVATIAPHLFKAAFVNNGASCSAIKRIYVSERQHASLVEALAACARAVVVGDGAIEGTELGPINNKPQYQRVSALVSDALSHGAHAAAGGMPLDGKGYFFAPTILTDVSDGTRIVDEEQFGPVLPVVAYRDLDEVIGRANATHFGLGASVWSNDADRMSEVAERIEAGTTWMNTHLALAPHQPFGGLKWSGIGVENGRWGLDGFTDIQVLHRSNKVGVRFM